MACRIDSQVQPLTRRRCAPPPSPARGEGKQSLPLSPSRERDRSSAGADEQGEGREERVARRIDSQVQPLTRRRSLRHPLPQGARESSRCPSPPRGRGTARRLGPTSRVRGARRVARRIDSQVQPLTRRRCAPPPSPARGEGKPRAGATDSRYRILAFPTHSPQPTASPHIISSGSMSTIHRTSSGGFSSAVTWRTTWRKAAPSAAWSWI